MTRVAHRTSAKRKIDELEERIEKLERRDLLSTAASQAGLSHWQDSSGTDQITIGMQSDGSYAIKVGSSIAIYATGANAGKIVGLIALTLSGALSAADISSTGSLSAADHQAGSNVPTLGGGNGAKIWVQSSDPGAAAANGDVWIQA